MNKPTLGMLVGALLGALDGLSAWMYPEARPMMVAIVIGSTIKGLVTGGIAGVVARRKHSVPLGVAVGLLIGFVLSTLAALGQPDHYVEIILPGMLIGTIVGYVTQRYPDAATTGRSTRSIDAALWVLLVGSPGVMAGQPAPSTDALSPIAFTVGRWEGTSEGQPGKGTVEREYSRILGSRFVYGRNRSTYPPQVKNPKGEEHEDISIFSFDTGRKRIVLRKFHVEGFVNQYVLDPGSKPESLVFTTEAIENIAAGWRARETYKSAGPDQFEETFELAAPGKEFEVYSRTRLTRVH